MESDLFFPITCFDWLTSDFSWNSIYSGGICAKQWFTSPFLIFFTSLRFHYILSSVCVEIKVKQINA